MGLKIAMLNPPFWDKFSKDSRSPAVSKGGCVYYPIWLGYATALLHKHGFEVKLLDCPAENMHLPECVQKIKEFQPKLIVLQTVTSSFYNDVKVLNELKKELPSDVFYLMVGTHVGAVPKESLLAAPNCDAVARGEFDLIVKGVADALEKGEDWRTVDGLSFRRQTENGETEIVHNPAMPELTGEQLDEFPFVSEIYKKYLTIENYFYPSVLFPEVTVISGRGCRYRCTFCKWPQTLTGHNYRARSPKNFVDELLWIEKNLPEVKDVMIEDDTLTQDKERTIAICKEILARGVKIPWTCNSRADVDAEVLHWMKKAGCRLMCVGFESADQQILNNIKKGTI
ncbi:MAG: cobalamin-dependent protein, partial [Candidatus Diapherotrites archaeon]|nr:cobalamin-dependent protein [Candidatus Diapherotrites archaeon]